MEKKTCHILFCALLIGMVGCAAMQRKRLNSMIGRDEPALVSIYGQPNNVYPIPTGGKLLIYSNAPTKRYHNDPYVSLGGGYVWRGDTTITIIPHSTQFTVNSNGVVTGWTKK